MDTSTKMSHSVRTATKDDAKVVIQMIREKAALSGMVDQCQLTVEKFIEDGFQSEPLFHCFIAEKRFKSGEIVIIGHALCHYSYSAFNGKNIYLEDLYVREPYRKHGVGTNLMKAVAKVGLENGCSQYGLACQSSNISALNFYRSKGAKDITDSEKWHLLKFENDRMYDLAADKK